MDFTCLWLLGGHTHVSSALSPPVTFLPACSLLTNPLSLSLLVKNSVIFLVLTCLWHCSSSIVAHKSCLGFLFWVRSHTDPLWHIYLCVQIDCKLSPPTLYLRLPLASVPLLPPSFLCFLEAFKIIWKSSKQENMDEYDLLWEISLPRSSQKKWTIWPH